MRRFLLFLLSSLILFGSIKGVDFYKDYKINKEFEYAKTLFDPTLGLKNSYDKFPNDDFDGDGLSNKLELKLKTDPLDPDTSNNGLSDGEAYKLGLDPTLFSNAGDGISDAVKLKEGLRPDKKIKKSQIKEATIPIQNSSIVLQTTDLNSKYFYDFQNYSLNTETLKDHLTKPFRLLHYNGNVTIYYPKDEKNKKQIKAYYYNFNENKIKLFPKQGNDLQKNSVKISLKDNFIYPIFLINKKGEKNRELYYFHILFFQFLIENNVEKVSHKKWEFNIDWFYYTQIENSLMMKVIEKFYHFAKSVNWIEEKHFYANSHSLIDHFNEIDELIDRKTVDSGFRPEKDGFSFANFASKVSPDGLCAGFANLAEKLFNKENVPIKSTFFFPHFNIPEEGTLDYDFSDYETAFHNLKNDSLYNYKLSKQSVGLFDKGKTNTNVLNEPDRELLKTIEYNWGTFNSERLKHPLKTMNRFSDIQKAMDVLKKGKVVTISLVKLFNGHVINVYKITPDQNNPDVYYLHVYDNNFPASKIGDEDISKNLIIKVVRKKSEILNDKAVFEDVEEFNFEFKSYGIDQKEYKVNFFLNEKRLE